MTAPLTPASLRIGNWVKDYKDRYVQVAEIHYKGGLWVTIEGIYQSVSNIEDISGIELSEDILVKAGFERTVTPMTLGEYIDYRIENFVCFLLKDKTLEVEYWSYMENIDERRYITTVTYLHQLSNLIFILTGKELEIRL